MNKDLEEIKQKIYDLDDHSKLYILGFMQGMLFDLKGFGEEEK